jgi:hypothetical protein
VVQTQRLKDVIVTITEMQQTEGLYLVDWSASLPQHAADSTVDACAERGHAVLGLPAKTAEPDPSIVNCPAPFRLPKETEDQYPAGSLGKLRKAAEASYTPSFSRLMPPIG